RSMGGTGAVYLRRSDSTVFNGNRCESIKAVNVVVIRAGKAPVTLTGNVVLGAEPVAPAPSPVKPPSMNPGNALTLHLPVGGGSTLAVPLDQELLLGGLERRRDVAKNTFSSLLSELATQPERRLLLDPETSPSTAAGTRPAVLDEATVRDVSTRLPAGMDVRLGAGTVYGTAILTDDSPTTHLRKLVDRVAMHAAEGSDIKSQVQSVLAASAGDPKKALQLVDKSVLGIDSAAPTVKESIGQVSILHEVLADAFYGGGGKGPKPMQEPTLTPKPLPLPDPFAHSVVVLGGSRVAAVGNASTSGIHVQGADAVTEFNP
ncbi:MAG TPA: hypothetical protein VEY30_00615, partial [Myxococcaceae bacterium]|nr:hypothetical protein [Myxococcaceae bacterium]